MIKDIRTLTPAQWNRIGDSMEEVAGPIGDWLAKNNFDGRGEQDREEFLGDMQCTVAAIRYVAAFASDKCKFLVINEKSMNQRWYEKQCISGDARMSTIYKPILFNTPMVQAILDGRKSQTRRICNPLTLNYPERAYANETPEQWLKRWHHKAPYKAGDILWVRETWQDSTLWDGPDGGYIYRASQNGRDWEENTENFTWRPSIFMPKEAARIFLRMTDVRIERVQEITTEDAKREGVDISSGPICPCSVVRDCHNEKRPMATYQAKFIIEWDEKHSAGFRKHQSYSDCYKCWGNNPWVWVFTFERYKKPEGW